MNKLNIDINNYFINLKISILVVRLKKYKLVKLLILFILIIIIN